jgi:hypothetical protein
MMAAASTSETSVNFYQTTRRNIPHDSHPHTRRRVNLKSHRVEYYLHDHHIPFWRDATNVNALLFYISPVLNALLFYISPVLNGSLLGS